MGAAGNRLQRIDVGSITDRYEQTAGQGRTPHDDHDETVQGMP